MTSLHSVAISRSKDGPPTAVICFQLPSASHIASASLGTCESQNKNEGGSFVKNKTEYDRQTFVHGVVELASSALARPFRRRVAIGVQMMPFFRHCHACSSRDRCVQLLCVYIRHLNYYWPPTQTPNFAEC